MLDYCERDGVLVSNSNVAQLVYAGRAGEAFVIDVRFLHNPKRGCGWVWLGVVGCCGWVLGVVVG